MNKESVSSNSEQSRTLKSDLKKFARDRSRDSLIGVGALAGTALVALAFQHGLSAETQPTRDELTCEVPASEYGTLWATAEAASPQDAPADEVQKTLGDIAFNNGLTTTQQLSASQELGLTAEQCSLVVEKDGTVTLLDE